MNIDQIKKNECIDYHNFHGVDGLSTMIELSQQIIAVKRCTLIPSSNLLLVQHIYVIQATYMHVIKNSAGWYYC